MSNDPRENLHGSDGQELADVTAAAEHAAEHAAEQAGEQAAMHMATSQTPAQSMADALAEMSTPSFEETLSALDEVGAPSEQEAAATLAEDGALDPQETLVSDGPLITPANSANSADTSTNSAAHNNAHNATGNDLAVAAPVHLPPAEPRPWYRSRRSFCAKGRGGRVQVAGLGITYTDHVTGAVLLADVDMGFRARTLSALRERLSASSPRPITTPRTPSSTRPWPPPQLRCPTRSPPSWSVCPHRGCSRQRPERATS